MAKILCLSDIHFDFSETCDSYGEAINSKLTESLESDKFKIMLEAFEKIGPIDLLVFCGDYILGRNSDETKIKSFEEFQKFLNKIESSPKLFNENVTSINDRIILIPGNHDVSRTDEDALSRFKKLTTSYISPLYEKNRKHPNAPVFIFDELKLIVACISTVNNSVTENEKIKEALSQISDTDLREKIKNILEEDMILDIPSVTENDRSSFISICDKLNDEPKYNDYFKLMVTHHPLLVGIETGNTIKKFNTTIGGYSFMKTAMSNGYGLFLHGHLHEKSCVKLTDFSMEEPKPIIQIGLPQCKFKNEQYVGVIIDTDTSVNAELLFLGNYLQYSDISRKLKQVRMLGENLANHDKYLGSKILVDYEIRKILEEGKIVKGGDFGNIQAASYDCTLGYKFKRKPENKDDDWSDIETEELVPVDNEPSSIEVKPNETVLIFTYEEFNIPNNMVLHASPISSWARKGLRVDISYFVDPGFAGNFCFPVKNESDRVLKINSQEPIMSIEFVQLMTDCEKNWAQRNEEKLLDRKKFKS